MKTTVLLTALFLFTTGSFAQTNVKNNEAVTDHASIKSNEDGSKFQNAAQASSTTSISSHVVKKAENKSRVKVKKEKRAIASEKSAIGTEASAKGQETKGEALAHRPDWATAHANAQAGGTGEGGSVKASIKSGKKIKPNVHSRAALHTQATPVKINTQVKTGAGLNIR